MAQIRQLHMMVDAIAMQHPEAAQDAEVVKQGLTNMMTRIVLSMSTTEPADAPRLV